MSADVEAARQWLTDHGLFIGSRLAEADLALVAQALAERETVCRQLQDALHVHAVWREQAEGRIAALEAFVEDIAGGDCKQYDKHLNPTPCGRCQSCRARALGAPDGR